MLLDLNRAAHDAEIHAGGLIFARTGRFGICCLTDERAIPGCDITRAVTYTPGSALAKFVPSQEALWHFVIQVMQIDFLKVP
jgi:hypothetical protein